MKYKVHVKVHKSYINIFEVDAVDVNEAEAKALELQNCAEPEPDDTQHLKEDFFIYEVVTS